MKGLESADVALPDHMLRKLIMSRDPLAPGDAYWSIIRLLVAEIFGFRTCDMCPRCVRTKTPCSNMFGSAASLTSGAVHRSDAAVGMSEGQGMTGSLHLHWFVYGQRLHQFATLDEIAQKLENGLVDAKDLYSYYEEIACTEYPNEENHVETLPKYEKEHPWFSSYPNLGRVSWMD